MDPSRTGIPDDGDYGPFPSYAAMIAYIEEEFGSDTWNILDSAAAKFAAAE